MKNIERKSFYQLYIDIKDSIEYLNKRLEVKDRYLKIKLQQKPDDNFYASYRRYKFIVREFDRSKMLISRIDRLNSYNHNLLTETDSDLKDLIKSLRILDKDI